MSDRTLSPAWRSRPAGPCPTCGWSGDHDPASPCAASGEGRAAEPDGRDALIASLRAEVAFLRGRIAAVRPDPRGTRFEVMERSDHPSWPAGSIVERAPGVQSPRAVGRIDLDAGARLNAWVAAITRPIDTTVLPSDPPGAGSLPATAAPSPEGSTSPPSGEGAAPGGKP